MLDNELEILAPAKVNLYLSVLSKRPDGYHELKTIMQKIELYDCLALSRHPSDITLSCPEANLPEDESNIAFRAAQSFFSFTGLQHGVQIRLNKKIPVAAGLGGGSSDAAAVLIGLDRLYGTDLSQHELHGLAQPLGADVPFFVQPSPAALATGIGDVLAPVPALKDCWLVLVNPGIAVSTKWVYDNFALTTEVNPYIFCGCSKSTENILHSGMAAPLKACNLGSLYNDLESVTLGEHPILFDIKAQLLKDGASASLMSGSGPTVFGLFDTLEQAQQSYAIFRSRFSEVFIAAPIGQ